MKILINKINGKQFSNYSAYKFLTEKLDLDLGKFALYVSRKEKE